MPQFPIPTPGCFSLPATMPACASGGRSPREPRVEYDKNRALFRDKCNQSWVLRPRRGDGERGCSHHGRHVRWSWCAHQDAHGRVCQHRCQGIRVLGHPFSKVSLCHAAVRHHPGAMAGGSEPSPSPLLGSRRLCEGAPGWAGSPTRACLLQPRQAGRDGARAVVARRARWGRRQRRQYRRQPRWARHGRVGDRRGNTHLPHPRASCSATRTTRTHSPGLTPASRTQ